jgi:hypothetical protein
MYAFRQIAIHSLVRQTSGTRQEFSWQINEMKSSENRSASVICKHGLAILVGCAVAIIAPAAQGQESPVVAVPVIFSHTIDASKAHIGDRIAARTLQAVLLPDGLTIPKGARVLGHVTEVRPFSFDTTPYAIQRPSFLAIRFDNVNGKEASIPVRAWTRALADFFDSESAFQIHYHDETDGVGTKIQVGGASYTPFDTTVLSSEGNAIEYNRRSGIFARLLPAEYVSRYSTLDCDSTDTEQSVAIFSPDACGLYGFDGIYMTENGRGRSGSTFRLESRIRSVKLAAGSTALLQVTALPLSR